MPPAEGAVDPGSSRRFRERLWLPPVLQWTVRLGAVVLLGVVVVGALSTSGGPWEMAVGLVLGLAVSGLVATVHGRVDLADGTLRLALFPVWRTTLALGKVAAVDRVAVRPLAQMGVLGLGRVDGTTVLALRPGDAVRVTLQDGRRYAVVSGSPEELLRAVRTARPPNL